MPIWLLVVLFVGASGKIGSTQFVFSSEEACTKMIPVATAQLLKDNITDGSVSCKPFVIGKLS